MARHIKVAEWEARTRAENSVIIELDDGDTIEIEPPILAEPRLAEMRKKKKRLTNDDVIRCWVGIDQVERWLATGRTLAQLDAVFTAAMGVTPGEAPASSTS